MMDRPDMPLAWEKVDLAGLRGLLMVVGASDVGKSTFARHLFQWLAALSAGVGYLDGDPGQSTLGPPTTMTLALAARGDHTFPPQSRIWRSFVGSVSPVGHMLPLLTGAARLVGAAWEAGGQRIIYDTTGLIDPSPGGTYLKLAQIDLLHPTVLFAIQHDQELEGLLVPLRRSHRVRVVDLPSSPTAQRRNRSLRQAHRAARFARYFSKACPLRVNWPQFAVFPAPPFHRHQLVAMEDANGFTIGLGIVEEIDRKSRRVVLHTPVTSLNRVDAIRLGDVAVDPQTFEDWRLTRRR